MFLSQMWRIKSCMSSQSKGYLTFAGAVSPQSLSGPSGVAVDASGNVYVADYSVNEVKEFIGGTGVPISVGSGFSSPSSVAVDRSGNVFVADTLHNAVKEIVAVNGSIPATDPTINSIGSGFTFPSGLRWTGTGTSLLWISIVLARMAQPGWAIKRDSGCRRLQDRTHVIHRVSWWRRSGWKRKCLR